MFYSCNKYIHLFILHQLCGGICSFGKNMRFILIWVISIEVPLPFHCPSWTPSTSAAPREWSSRSWTRAPWRAATPTRRSPACCAPCPEQPVVQGSDLTDLADSKWSKRSFHFGSLNIHACSIWGGAASVSHFRHSTFSLTASQLSAPLCGFDVRQSLAGQRILIGLKVCQFYVCLWKGRTSRCRIHGDLVGSNTRNGEKLIYSKAEPG